MQTREKFVEKYFIFFFLRNWSYYLRFIEKNIIRIFFFSTPTLFFLSLFGLLKFLKFSDFDRGCNCHYYLSFDFSHHFTHLIKSPPIAYSMTKNTCSWLWKVANRLIRNGCLLELKKNPKNKIRKIFIENHLAISRIRFSTINDSTSSLAKMSPFLRIFRAWNRF